MRGGLCAPRGRAVGVAVVSVLAASALCGPAAAAAPYVPGTPGAPWSREEMLMVKAKLYKLFDADQAQHVAWELTSGRVRIPARPVALVLRLSFHDCLKYTDGTGGCDGCLDLVHGFLGELDGPWYQWQLDLADVNPNNGLEGIVEILEGIYTRPAFPRGTPDMGTSLRDRGKSRADFWAFAGIVAVEYAIETNNGVCDNAAYEVPPGYIPSSNRWDWARMDPHNGGAHCNDAQGEARCRVDLERAIKFETGRVDCVTDDGGYVTEKPEYHPDPHTNGAGTAAFFERDFGFNGREMVAILGAHTIGRLHMGTSMLPYVWIKSGGQQFNNQYYRNLASKPAWFFVHKDGTHTGCTKVGDAYGRAQTRWLANTRLHLKTGGPAFWIQEKLVCDATCVRDDGAVNPEACCAERPDGAFCKPDDARPVAEDPEAWDTTPEGGCERYKFHNGLDECMLNVDMGMYKKFEVTDGIMHGCPGFETFNKKQWMKHWQPGTQFESHWSTIGGRRAEPQCPYNDMRVGGSDPLYQIIDEYAEDQDRWIRDFVPAFEKMLRNGYGAGGLTGPVADDQWTHVVCPRRMPEDPVQTWACEVRTPPPTPSPPTPSPPTPSPPTASPLTPAPQTPSPPTPAPATPVPATGAPATPAPSTTVPMTAVPTSQSPPARAATAAPRTPATAVPTAVPGTPAPVLLPATGMPPSDTPAPAPLGTRAPLDPSSGMTTAPAEPPTATLPPGGNTSSKEGVGNATATESGATTEVDTDAPAVAGSTRVQGTGSPGSRSVTVQQTASPSGVSSPNATADPIGRSDPGDDTAGASDAAEDDTGVEWIFILVMIALALAGCSVLAYSVRKRRTQLTTVDDIVHMQMEEMTSPREPARSPAQGRLSAAAAPAAAVAAPRLHSSAASDPLATTRATSAASSPISKDTYLRM